MTAIEARKIEKRYGTKLVLDVESFSARYGEATVILGANGAGKSTLLQALALASPPDLGQITVGEKTFRFPVRELDPIKEGCWPTLSMTLQQNRLWPHMSVRDNIELPATRAGVPKHEVDALLQKFELLQFAKRLPHELSGGEHQRAIIARIMAVKPQILLLDEPTSAFDVYQARMLADVLVGLCENGRSVIVVTHQIGFARRIANKLYLMSGGRIVCCGGTDILEKPPNEAMRDYLEFA